jgi:hypothetical protein
MDDTERLIRDVPSESPPPEIVLAAVRTFRYRAIAVVFFVITAVIAGTWLGHRLVVTPLTLDRIALAKAEHGWQPVFAEGEVAGVRVLFLEVIPEPDRAQAWAHVVAWDPAGREIFVEIRGFSVDGKRVPEVEVAPSFGQSGGAVMSSEAWSAFAIDRGGALPPRVSTEVEVLTYDREGRQSLGVVELSTNGGGR